MVWVADGSLSETEDCVGRSNPQAQITTKTTERDERFRIEVYISINLDPAVHDRPMVMTVVAARTNRVSDCLSVIVSDGLSGYLLGGDGRRPLCHWDLLCDIPNVNQI